MYCTKCGQKFHKDSNFCEYCGQSAELNNENVVFPRISFIKALELGYRRAPDFKGRSRRSEYWWWVLFATTLNIISGVIPIIGIFVTLLLIIPTISVTTRRLHDINLSGWWQAPIQALSFIIILLPGSPLPSILSIIFSLMILGCFVIFIYWTAKDGDKGPNDFGDSPKFPKQNINQNI